MPDEEMVWVYSGESFISCPRCRGRMSESGGELHCKTCNWPNDRREIIPAICVSVIQHDFRHRVVSPGPEKDPAKITYLH